MNKLAAQRYAVSFFELANEENCLLECFDEIMSIGNIFSQNADLVKLLASPSVAKPEKASIIDSIFGGRISQYTLNFIKLLTDKGRIDCYSGIAEHFKQLYNEQKNIQEVTAITAVPLSDSLKQKLAAKLENITGKTIVLENKVDTGVLGGIMLKMANEQLDSTVKSRLDGLRHQISAIIA